MLNKQMLIGNVGKDPEVKDFEGGTKMAKFSVATTSGFGDKAQTVWHNIVCFGKTAENVEKYVTKGMKVYVEGETRHNSYEKDGETKYHTNVNAFLIRFLSKGEGKPKTQEEIPF